MALASFTGRSSVMRVCPAYHNAAVRQLRSFSVISQPIGQTSRLLSSRPQAGSKGKAPPPPPPPPVEEVQDIDEGEDYDPLAELTATARRRVAALKEVQKKYEDINRDYHKEWAALQAKYTQQYAPLFDERKEIVLNKKAVPALDIEDDGEPDEGIPEFWLTAFANNNKVGQFVSERDSDVLKYLEDVRSEVLTGEDRGFKLSFHFGSNPYFENTVLETTYVLEPEDDVVPKNFIGTAIKWKEGMDVTVEIVKKRVKAPKGDKAKAKAFVSETIPCDSFFNIFDPPQVPTEADGMADEELDEIQDALSNVFEIGYAIKESIIPRAVEWYTGEIASFDDEYYDDEYAEGEDEDQV